MPWRAVPVCILHRGCFRIVMLVASGWLPCAFAGGLGHGKTVIGLVRLTPGVAGVNQRPGASRFAPGGTPPARSRQAFGPARRHFHSPGGSKGTVRRWCFVRQPSPSKRRESALGRTLNRSVPPVARLLRIFGSHSLFQGNAPFVFSDAATDMTSGSIGGFYLPFQSFRFFWQRLFPSS